MLDETYAAERRASRLLRWFDEIDVTYIHPMLASAWAVETAGLPCLQGRLIFSGRRICATRPRGEVA